jgi:hypothetical protein
LPARADDRSSCCYPGGCHPHGLDGAVCPAGDEVQRLAPGTGGYVVVDVPEAIWSNLGLTYWRTHPHRHHPDEER